MRRRRVIGVMVVLVCLGAFVAWRLTYQVDPQLVGEWLERDGRQATADELERAANRRLLYAKSGRTHMTVWTLQADGSGSVTKLLSAGAGACRWRTRGDRLFVQFNPRVLTVRERLVELWESLCGEHPKSWHEYRYIVDGPEQIRVAFGDPGHEQSRWQLHLTRIHEAQP